jgi:hypothetical protein
MTRPIMYGAITPANVHTALVIASIAPRCGAGVNSLIIGCPSMWITGGTGTPIMIMAIFAATLSSWISQVTTTDCGLRIVKVPVAGPPLVEL